MGNRTSRTVATDSTTPANNTTPRGDQQPAQEDAQDAPEVPPRSSSLPLARARSRFPELFGSIEQLHAYQMNMRNATVSGEQQSFNPSLPSLTANRSQQRRQENHYARLPLSSAQTEAAQRHVIPLRLPNPPAVPPWRLAHRRNRLSSLRNQPPEESSNSAATVATTQAGATAAIGTTASTVPADAIAATNREGAVEQQPIERLRAIAEWRASRLVRAPSQGSQSGELCATVQTSTSAYRSEQIAAPRQLPTRKPTSGQLLEWQHGGGGEPLGSNLMSPAPLPFQPQRPERPIASPRRSPLRSRVQPVVVQRPGDGDASATVTALGDTAVPGSLRTISLTPAGAYQPERSRQPPAPVPRRGRQSIELHPPRPSQGNDQGKAMIDESARKPPSSPNNFGRKAYSAASPFVVRWSPDLAPNVPPPPLEPPPPPPSQPRFSLVAAAASPDRVQVAAQSPIALDRSCDNKAVGESGYLAVTVPPPPALPPPSLPPPPPPSPPARHSFSVATDSDPVHYAAPICAARSPTAQLRNRDQAKARQAAAAADSALPVEPHRTQKERQQHQSQPMQHKRHGEVQTRRLDAMSGRPLPRMLNEALDEDKLLVIRRLAAQRSIARRASAATGSDSVRCGDHVFATGTADAATSPQPFSVFGFGDSTIVEVERRELEHRRAQHELYDDELWRRTGEAAAASSPVSRRLQCDAFTFGEASAIAAVRRSTTSAPESTTSSHRGAGHPSSSHGAEGGVGCSQWGRGAISGLPLCGRLQPEAGYYGSNPLVPK